VQQSCGSVAVKREGGERARAKANRGVRLQRGKYLGRKDMIKHYIYMYMYIL
jgi:hypothetical protein